MELKVYTSSTIIEGWGYVNPQWNWKIKKNLLWNKFDRNPLILNGIES